MLGEEWPVFTSAVQSRFCLVPNSTGAAPSATPVSVAAPVLRPVIAFRAHAAGNSQQRQSQYPHPRPLEAEYIAADCHQTQPSSPSKQVDAEGRSALANHDHNSERAKSVGLRGEAASGAVGSFSRSAPTIASGSSSHVSAASVAAIEIWKVVLTSHTTGALWTDESS